MIRVVNADQQLVREVQCAPDRHVLGRDVAKATARTMGVSLAGLTFTLPSEGRVLHSRDELVEGDVVQVYCASSCVVL
jgi:hypothetical protein